MLVAEKPWTVFWIFLRLGMTSFGGPIAHLAYFHEEFVNRRRWLTTEHYADLVALCQFLPGPASSQLGISLGLMQAGYAGAFAAWLGFTLPSALIMVLLANLLSVEALSAFSGVMHGLKLAAVAVVAQAVWSMGRTLCQSRNAITLMAISCCFVLFLPSLWVQVTVLVFAALIGGCCLSHSSLAVQRALCVRVPRRQASGWLCGFLALLLLLPLFAYWSGNQELLMVDAFYRSGALVFGGGHVVLPLLQAETVGAGWISNEVFLAGYAAAQAMPGPLFTLAAFLGAVIGGWSAALLCLLAIFLPAFLLVVAALPFWEQLRGNMRVQTALMGLNAAVVGILLAALYQPVWYTAVHQARDFGLVVLAFTGLVVWQQPPGLVVALMAVVGWWLY